MQNKRKTIDFMVKNIDGFQKTFGFFVFQTAEFAFARLQKASL
jgi:hypothetical protein